MVRFPSDGKRSDPDSGGDGGRAFGAFRFRSAEQTGGALSGFAGLSSPEGDFVLDGELSPHLRAGLATGVAPPLSVGGDCCGVGRITTWSKTQGPSTSFGCASLRSG